MQTCLKTRFIGSWRSKGASRLASVTTMAQSVPAVVTCDWLAARLGQPDIKILDASWYMPNMGRNSHDEFKSKRIPGAKFWDIDGVADTTTDLPHMLPSEAAFAAAADALGVANQDTVVVYDGMGMFSAPRAWWTWRVFGHERVAVLEGGLTAWAAAGLPLEDTPAAPEELQASKAAAAAAHRGGASSGGYKAKLDQSKVRSLEDMKALVAPAAAALSSGAPVPPLAEQVLDARSAGRFIGVEPEPRPGLRGGHTPGAHNVPFPQVYAGGAMAGAKLKPKEELEQVFAAAGLDVAGPVVCSCGSGLTGCILALALHQVTGEVPALYDGSWSEWGALEDTPVATTPSRDQQQ